MSKGSSSATPYQERERYIEKFPEVKKMTVRRRKSRIAAKETLSVVLKIVIGLGIGACLGRMELFGRIFPLGPAYSAVWLTYGMAGGLPVILATFLSLTLKLPGRELFPRIALYIALPASAAILKKKRDFLSYGVVFLFFAGLCLIWRLTGLTKARIVAGVGEAILSYGFYRFLSPGLNYLFTSGRRTGISKESGYSLGLLIFFIYIALGQGLQVVWGRWEVDPSLILAIFLIFLTAKKYGAGMSSIVGLLFMAGDIIIGPASPWRMTLLAGTGLMAGLGNEAGGFGFGLGFFINLLLVAGRWRGAEGSIDGLLTAVVVFFLFQLIPLRLRRRMEEFLPEIRSFSSVDEMEKKFNEMVSSRLQGISELLSELSRVFSGKESGAGETKKSEVDSVIEEITETNCRNCRFFNSCWKDSFYPTYREVFDLVAVAEMCGAAKPEHLKGRLAGECREKEKLLSTINYKVEKHRAESTWRKRYEEGRSFLSGQLQGMAGVMKNLSQQVRLNLHFKDEIVEELKRAFLRMGLAYREIYAAAAGRNSIEIYLEKESCGAKEECSEVLAPLVSELLGERFAVHKKECRPEGGFCRCTLSSRCIYGLRAAVNRRPRAGNELSGDTYRMVETGEGYMAALLSDGMGVGPEAARQSNITVSLMEKLLNMGLDKRSSLQLINSVLLLRSPEENFATLDLFVLDRFTAEGEFIKIGAAPTYIKRGGEIDVIRSTSLPVGILNSVEPEYIRYPLKENDLIIMMTDGFHGLQKEGEGDWILKALKKLDFMRVDSLCEYLQELAMIQSGGGIEDDMTVAVFKVINEVNMEKPRNSLARKAL